MKSIHNSVCNYSNGFDVRRDLVHNIHGIVIYISYMILYSAWRWLLWPKHVTDD